MSRWFRFYDDVINDPKVLKLPEGVRWAWVAVLCIASKHGGKLPSIQDMAFLLRVTVKKATAIVDALVIAGLLDKTTDGCSPHNWGGRQFLADSSAERVKRHREKREAAGLQSQWTAPKSLRKAVYARDNHECVYCGSPDDLTLDHMTPEARGGTHDIENLQTCCRRCNASKRDLTHDEYVTRNGHVTLLKRPQTTETEYRTEAKKKDPPLRSDDWPDDHGDQFWQAYPRKTEKLATMKKLATLRKSGIVTFGDLMAGAKRYAVAVANTDPKYTKQPPTWLNAGCWADEIQTGDPNGNRNLNTQRRSASADFFAGMRSLAEDIVGDDQPPGPASPEVPLGRVNIDL